MSLGQDALIRVFKARDTYRSGGGSYDGESKVGRIDREQLWRKPAGLGEERSGTVDI